MKRLVALLLAVAMAFSLCVPAFAVDTGKRVDEDIEDYEIVKCSDEVSLAFEYMKNGDIACHMILNGVIVSKATYVAALDRIEHVKFGEKAERTVRELAPMREKMKTHIVEDRAQREWVTAGSITYRYYVQGWPETRTLGVKYREHSKVSSTVDLNGEYRDFAEFVLMIMVLLTMPRVVAAEVALYILERRGLVDTMVDFFLPETIVDADEYKIEWEASYGENEGNFSGSRYYVTQEGYAGRIHYDTKYFAPSAYNNRNQQLAETLRTCINLYWGDGQYDIVSWG